MPPLRQRMPITAAGEAALSAEVANAREARVAALFKKDAATSRIAELEAKNNETSAALVLKQCAVSLT